MIGWYDRLIQRSAFPKVEHLEHELKKVGLFRIMLGMVVFLRFAEISHTIWVLGDSSSLLLLTLVYLAIVFCFTVGFLTPLATLGLMLTSIRVDIYCDTLTLGTAVLILTLVPILLINPGQYYSVDRWLINKGGWPAKLLLPMYSVLGAQDKTDITRAYFTGFVLYGVISFGALLLHIQDPYWTQGLTTKSLLINSYLCKYYPLFRHIEAHIPILLSVLGISAGIFQTIFQFLMIPLMFNKWGRWYVFLWGLNFFFISLVFINLSYLPHIEVLLWFMVLYPVAEGRKTMQILYDDHCNLCKRAMRFFKFINYNGRIEFLPLSENRDVYERHNLTEADVKAYMAGIMNGRVYKGYQVYYEVSKMNKLLWPLWPIFLLGKIGGIGPAIYNNIAERRYRFFGQCELSFGDEIAAPQPILQCRSYPLLTKLIIGYFFVGIIIYSQFRCPFVKDWIPKPVAVEKAMMQVLIYSGFDLPNVFNAGDLSAGDKWLVVYRYDEGTGWVLTPFTGLDGQRLNYQHFDFLNFTNYNSDLLYFGTSSVCRRALVWRDVNEHMAKNENGYFTTRRRIKYDYNYYNFTGIKQYHLQIFSNHTSKVSHDAPDLERYKPTMIYETYYSFDGDSLEIIMEK